MVYNLLNAVGIYNAGEVRQLMLYPFGNCWYDIGVCMFLL